MKKLFLIVILFFMVLSASLFGKTVLLEKPTEKPAWMAYSSVNHKAIEDGRLFFGYAEGGVEADVRTAAFKDAQQQVSFSLGTQVRALLKDYQEKGGSYTVDASIQTGTQVLIHSYLVQYYQEKWNDNGTVVYRIYTQLKISDKQYNELKLLVNSSVELAVRTQNKRHEDEFLLKKIGHYKKWNIKPVVSVVKSSSDEKKLYASEDSAYIALLTHQIQKVGCKDSTMSCLKGAFTLELYNQILTKQPRMWETDTITVSAASEADAYKKLYGEAFRRLKEVMRYNTTTLSRKENAHYYALSHFNPELMKLYEEAEKIDKESALFPHKAIESWQRVVECNEVEKDPRKRLAQQRIADLHAYINQIKELKKEYPHDAEKLRKFFKMDVKIIKKNISVARNFIRKYGLLYGVSEVQKVVVDAVKSEKKQKDILNEIYADSWLAVLKQSCEKKNPNSCYFYGYGLELQGKKPDAYEQYYAQACHGNAAFACYNFAIMLLENCSKGVKIPLEKAVKACELGYAQSCFTVGMIYKKGKCSGDIDRKRALIYFKKSCDAGYYGGCALAGALYEDDKKVGDAQKQYKKACDLGYEKGCEAYNRIR